MIQQANYYNLADELDEEIIIDLRKIFYALWSRKFLVAKVFVCVLAFFVLLTFILPKTYKVESDLYINKSNNSNMVEINPYVIEELGDKGGMAALMGVGGSLSNELELIQSPLVIDKVIRENDLRFKKIFGIIPTKRTGEYLTTKAFLKKNITFKNKKSTNVVTIEYKSKNPELAYNVVNSVIKNYIVLHKQLQSEKSKSDKKVIEQKYNEAKVSLKKKSENVGGLPSEAAIQAGTLSAMSAFSTSASKALSQIKGQVVAGEKARMEITEEASKVASLSSKLEWAKMVEEMSATSKVLVLKEPQKLRAFEQYSPKLFINIVLGIVFGVIISLLAVILVENLDKKLTYSMLGDNVVYDPKNDFSDLKLLLLAKQNKRILCALLDDISPELYENLKKFKNVTCVKAEISDEFVSLAQNADEAILFSNVGVTSSKLYKQIKMLLGEMNKKIIKEALV